MEYRGHGNVSDLVELTDAEAALARISAIYEGSAHAIRAAFTAFTERGEAPAGPLSR